MLWHRTTFRYLRQLVIGGALAVVALSGSASQRSAVEPFVLTNMFGNKISLEQMQGKVVLINFWATWCPPCVKEMPTLDRLQQRLGGDFFQVVVLSVDGGGFKVVRPFFEQTRIKNLDMYLDPNFNAANALGAHGMPTTILIDVKGRELGRLVGDAEWDAPEMIRFFRKIIAMQL